jgi:hypothetical protein
LSGFTEASVAALPRLVGAFGALFTAVLVSTGFAAFATGFLFAALRLAEARVATAGAAGTAGTAETGVEGDAGAVLMAPPWSYRSNQVQCSFIKHPK